MEAVKSAPEKTPREKLLDLEGEINGRVFEREEPVRGFLVGIVVRAHVLIVSLPGAAKSMMGRLLCDAIAWNGVPEGFDPYFRTQLSGDSVTDELFGPVSAKGFREDTYQRNTAHMVPETKIALIEEVYKANTATRNRLLSVMNEGLFKNGSLPETEVPLRLLLASSNELPEEGDTASAAFHDRFMLRYKVGYLKDPANVRKMMEWANRPEARPAPLSAAITEAELDRAAHDAARVDASPVFDAIDDLLSDLASRQIVPSDRRRAALVRLVKGQAYLEGRTAATPDDLSILAHALWEDPDDIPEVRKAVLRATKDPAVGEAQKIFDDASDSHAKAVAAADAVSRNDTEETREAARDAGLDANTDLRNAERKLENLLAGVEKPGSDEPAAAIQDLLGKVRAMIEEVRDRCF